MGAGAASPDSPDAAPTNGGACSSTLATAAQHRLLAELSGRISTRLKAEFEKRGRPESLNAEPMIHVMLPEQYLREARTRLAEPEKRLALAVLQTVLYDCRARAAVGDGRARVENQRAYERALAYVESHDRSWPYSFENLCETIGLDPGSLRRRIARTGLAAQ